MKKTKLATLALATLFVATPLASCGPKQGDKDTLNITVSNLGFGTDWLYTIAEEFERIEGVTVDISTTVNHANMLTQLETGYQLDDLLMFAGLSSTWETMRLGLMTNLNDVWSAIPEGETQTISQKVHPAYAELYRMVDDNYYSMPFITETGGFAYNKTTLDILLGEGNWELPKTTNQFTALVQRVKNAGGYGFTWVNKENAFYWGGRIDVWAAQYNGIEFSNHQNRAEIWDEEQQKYVIDVKAKGLDELGYNRAYEIGAKYALKDEKGGYSHRYCTSMSFMESQAAFAGAGYGNDDKLVAFTPNGNWLYQESKEDIEAEMQDIGLISEPILSSIVEKFENYPHPVSIDESYEEDLDEATKAAYDAMLIEIIDYINAGKTGTKPTGIEGFQITDNDIAFVESAMNIAQSKDQAHAFIPVNSRNPELAKKFLIFLASDYAGQLYGSVTHGFSPFYIQMDDDNKDFYVRYDYDSYNILNKSNWLLPYSKVGFYISSPDNEQFFEPDSKYATGGMPDPDKMFAGRKELNLKNQAGNITAWEYKLRQAGLINNGDT